MPSAQPPAGLAPDEVPMFVSLGFDDNGDDEALTWVLDHLATLSNPPGAGRQETYDGQRARATFYLTSDLGSDPAVAAAWQRAHREGHELGVHTATHTTSETTDRATWEREIESCVRALVETTGIGRRDILGFRAPFLALNDAALEAVVAQGLLYDCSVEEGFSWLQDGTDFLWPYTLDGGSPGNEILVEWGSKRPLLPHPGLWELPVYAVLAPPDELSDRYGVAPGLRARLAERVGYFDPEGGKITGFDYNLWYLFGLSGDEALAVLRYTLDLRLAGNRAPLLLGVHSDLYGEWAEEPPAAPLEARRRALTEFLAYALSRPEVRLVSARQLLDWLRRPVPLVGAGQGAQASAGSSSPSEVRAAAAISASVPTASLAVR